LAASSLRRVDDLGGGFIFRFTEVGQDFLIDCSFWPAMNILSRDKQTEIIAALCEGVGQRAAQRPSRRMAARDAAPLVVHRKCGTAPAFLAIFDISSGQVRLKIGRRSLTSPSQRTYVSFPGRDAPRSAASLIRGPGF
jgi:hypothetical protein